MSTTKKFQFPSNGKVDPNWGVRYETSGGLGFNSLQTGKWILTKNVLCRPAPASQVSIPFKRESGS